MKPENFAQARHRARYGVDQHAETGQHEAIDSERTQRLLAGCALACCVLAALGLVTLVIVAWARHP